MSAELPEKLKEFYDHWAGLPREGLVPSLSEFLGNPSPEFQPYVAIYDVVDNAASLPLRLFGTGLVSFNGGDLTGKDFLMSAEPNLRETISYTVRKQVEQPCGRTDVREVASSSGKSVETQSLSLPLLTGDGKPPSIVLFLNYMHTIGYGETLGAVIEISDIRWVDIGAGIPEDNSTGTTAAAGLSPFG